MLPALSECETLFSQIKNGTWIVGGREEGRGEYFDKL